MRRVMILPCTVDEFLGLTPAEASMLEAAVYIEGDGGEEGPFLPGWSSVGGEFELSHGQPVPARFDYEGPGADFYTLVVRGEDGSYRCEPDDEENRGEEVQGE